MRARIAPDVSVERALRVLIRLQELEVSRIVLDLVEEALPGTGPALALDGRPVLLGDLEGPAGDPVQLTLWISWAHHHWDER